MRDAVERAACSSCLGTALGLAAPAASVRLALLRVASSRLDAALGLASLAAAVRKAVPRAALSSLGAALVLAASCTALTKRHGYDGILTAGAALPSGYISARAKVVRPGWQPSAPHPPPWRWSSHRVLIASRSVGAEGGSDSAPSGCGCAARRQSLQYTLPGA
jgi:hypothetical protein